MYEIIITFFLPMVDIMFLILEYHNYHSEGWDSHSSETRPDPFCYFQQLQMPHVTLLDWRDRGC